MSLYCNVWQYTRVSSVFRSRNSETSGLWMYHYVMILAGNCRLFLLFRLMCNSWSANVPVSDFQQLPFLFGTFSTQFMQFDFSHARIQKCYVLLFTCLEIWKFFFDGSLIVARSSWFWDAYVTSALLALFFVFL